MLFTNNYVWLAPLAISLLNGIIIRKSSQSQILLNPKSEEGFKKILFFVIVYANIPWVIMGIGNVLELSNNGDYIKIDLGNPFVLTFYLSILILLGFMIRWIYFKNGAEFIQEHPMRSGLFDSGDLVRLNARQIKVGFGFVLVAALSSIIFLWIRNKSR